jgi:small-conductance mechanosensitive channel
LLVFAAAPPQTAGADGPAFPANGKPNFEALAANESALPPSEAKSSPPESSMPERWLSEGWRDVEHVWDYPLTEVQGEKKTDIITVGTIVDGVVLFLAGIFASRFISHVIGRWLLSRMGVNASAAAAFQSVAFYLLFLLFTLLTLRLLDVPLTAFTVLGGAVALGVGFGSQNIVNNFISGLVLLAERPVKVGDLIQVGELYGNVEHIGARSTRVKTGENLDIIVPNSTFLQTNVINWTRNDNHMRTCVKFGVMYGSPIGKVTSLALKAVANHNRVFDKPPPFVLFAEFGDNALQFELHFWVAVHTLTERLTIESDIRYNVEHLFREAGVVIAYPQRDMHLYAEQPLRVQMLAAEERGEPDAA